jgi:two-component system sensor histidine kinase KdpD
LLEMARLHAGEVTLHKEWHPVEEVIGSSIKLLGRALAKHPVKVSLAEHLPLVEFDAVLIERVICNLLENAAKYAPEGSVIEITVRTIGEWLKVGVCDSGPGFAGQDAGQDALFEMFVRGETESSKPGVGLGLAICRAIVEAHGGTICADNRIEGGACVSFTLSRWNSPPIANCLSHERRETRSPRRRGRKADSPFRSQFAGRGGVPRCRGRIDGHRARDGGRG